LSATRPAALRGPQTVVLGNRSFLLGQHIPIAARWGEIYRCPGRSRWKRWHLLDTQPKLNPLPFSNESCQLQRRYHLAVGPRSSQFRIKQDRNRWRDADAFKNVPFPGVKRNHRKRDAKTTSDQCNRSVSKSELRDQRQEARFRGWNAVELRQFPAVEPRGGSFPSKAVSDRPKVGN